ncbi:MAG: hypothetical protein IKU82_03655 [Clostridia bacterium]|nr:hypothetical protein [Clostridia bacterium]
MAIKVIEYNVNLNGITPASEQFAGTQGDHKATKMNFTISDELYSQICNMKTDTKVMYRFDLYDGEGGLWQSEPKEFDTNNLEFELEERHTRYGGNISVYLVITALTKENETELELYNFPARLRLNNRPEGVTQQGESYESVTSLASAAKNSAIAAENSKIQLQQLAKQLEEKLENGDFDGEDGISVTHSWNGTVLTVTSASGTFSADLKGEKGDPGNDGKDAVIEQSFNPESQNAQSGKAVAQGIDDATKNKIDKIPSKQRETLDGKNGQIGLYATNDYGEGNPFLAQLHYNWEPYTIPFRLASGQIHVGLSGYDEIEGTGKIFQDSAVPKSYLAMIRQVLENSISTTKTTAETANTKANTAKSVADTAKSAANIAKSTADTALTEANSKKITSSYTSAKTTLDFNSVYILWSNSGNVDIELYNDSTNTRVADTAGETLATAKVCVLFLPESSSEITSDGSSRIVGKRCLYFGVTGTPSFLNTNVVSKQFVVNSGNLYFIPATAVSVFKIAL